MKKFLHWIETNRPALKRWLAIFSIFTAIALLLSLQIYFARKTNNTAIPFAAIFVLQLIGWYLWAILTPVILRLGEKFSIFNNNWLRNFSIHLLSGFIISSLYLLGLNSLLFLVEPAPVNAPSFLENYRMFFLGQIHVTLFIYWGILLAGAASRFYRKNHTPVSVKNGREVESADAYHLDNGYLERLVVKSNGRSIVLKTALIQWIEAADYYVNIHYAKQQYLLRESMQTLENKLHPDKFVRIHRSTIVNIDHIKALEPFYNGSYIVTLADGTELRLSRSRREKLLSVINGIAS